MKNGKYEEALQECKRAESSSRFSPDSLKDISEKTNTQVEGVHLHRGIVYIDGNQYLKAKEELAKIKSSVFTNELIRLRESLQLIHPTNIIVKADSLTDGKEKLALYKKAEKDLELMKEPSDDLRNKIIGASLESALQIEIDTPQDEILDKLNQIKYELNYRTNFKAKLDEKAIDKLSDKLETIVRLRYNPKATENYLSNLDDISNKLEDQRLRKRVQSIAGYFIDTTLDKIREIKPEVFGSEGEELLEKALSLNKRYALGKEKELGETCFGIAIQLKDKTRIKDSLVKLLYNNLDWLSNEKRTEMKAKLFDVYFNAQNSATNAADKIRTENMGEPRGLTPEERQSLTKRMAEMSPEEKENRKIDDRKIDDRKRRAKENAGIRKQLEELRKENGYE